MSRQYIVDKDFKLKKERPSFWAALRRVMVFFVATLSLAIVYYILFALVFSTEEERQLRLENRLYEMEYPQMAAKEQLLADVVEGLKVKDDRIYEEIFNTAAPNMEQFSSLDFLMGLDSIPDSDIVTRSASRLDFLEARGHHLANLSTGLLPFKEPSAARSLSWSEGLCPQMIRKIG